MHMTSGSNQSTPDRVGASSSGRLGAAAVAVGTSTATTAHKRKPSDGGKTKVRRYSTFQRTNGDLGGHHRTASERELSGDRRGSPRRRRDDGPLLASGMSSPGFPGAGLGRENVDPVPAAAPSVARRNLDSMDADLAAVALQFPEELGGRSAGGSTIGAAPSTLFTDPGTGTSGIHSSMLPSPPRPSKGPAATRSILGEMPSPSPKSLYNSPPRSNSSRSNSVCSNPRESPSTTGTGRCLPATRASKFGATASSHHVDTGMDIDIDQDHQDDDAHQATLSAAAMAAGQAAQMAITATTITSSTGLTMRRKPSVGDVIGPFQEAEVGAGATDTTITTGNVNMIDLPPDLHGGRRTPLGGVAGPFTGSLNFGDELMAEADGNEPVTSNTKNNANDSIVPRGSGTIVRRRRSSSNNFGTPSGSPVATRRRSGGGGSLFASPSSRQRTPRIDFHAAQTPMRYTFGFNKNPFAPLTPDIQMMINGNGEAPLTSTDGSPLGPSRPIYPKSDGAFDFNGGGRIKPGSNLLFSVGGSRPGGGSSNSNSGRRGGRRVNRPYRRPSPPNFAISIPDLASASPARRSGPKDAPTMPRSPSKSGRYRKREGGQIVDVPLDQEISPDTVAAFPHQQLRRSPGIDYYVTLKDDSSGTNAADAAADTSFGSSGSTGSRAPPLPPTKTRPAISRLPPCSRSPSPSIGIPGGALSSPMVQIGDIDEPSSRRSNCSVRSNGLNNSTSSGASFNYNRYDNDFQEIDIIGRGSFGEVCRAIHRLEGILYAIKKIEVRNECDLTLKMKEIYALAALSDSSCGGAFHIVRYHHSWVEGSGCDEPKRLFIQMELCDHTLVQEIEQGRLAQDNGDRLFKLLREMCLALNVIHTNNLVHLDVKPDNIFIKDDKFKLGDFGLANSIDAGDTDEGDNRYMAREMLAFHSVDRARCDIFSLGATMYRICLGRELPGSGDEWNDIRNDKLDQLEGTHPELKRYIAEMMHSDPSKRPTAKELLTREFLLSDQEKQLLAQRRQVQELEEQLRKAQLQAPKSGLVRSSSIL